jgi:membrane dipeptidase
LRTYSFAVLALAIGALTLGHTEASGPAADPLLQRARALHRSVPLVDGHNDYPWAVREKSPSLDLAAVDIRGPQPRTMTDIPRLRAGGVGAQFWSVYVPASLQGQAAVRTVLEQIDLVHRLVARYPDTFALARTAAEVERIFKAGRIASMPGMEGGHAIDSSLAALRMMYALGVRYLTLTHSDNLPWADAATDTPRLGGLSAFGEEVVREMNRLGMLVDLSHVSADTMDDALRVSRAPVIFSHSSARAICDHPRNVPDDILTKLRANGGVVMVTFVPGFVATPVAEHGRRETAERERLAREHGTNTAAIDQGLAAWRSANPAPRASLVDVANHIDHIRKVAGIEHIGLGSDFDGITTVPVGLEDVSTFPALLAELLRRGYSDDDIRRITGRNLLRVLRGAEAAARGR